MRSASRALVGLCAALLLSACGSDGNDNAAATDSGEIQALVFSRTGGFRHASIEDAVVFFNSLAPEEGIKATLTEDPAVFNDTDLAGFDVVVFANTTGDVLDEAQQQALQRFIRSGKGYVGVHSAADTEYDWPWYGQLVGAYFISHPWLPIEVEVTTEDPHHPSTAHLPETFRFTDEIYNFDRNPRSDHAILLTIDEAGFIWPNTDGKPSMGADHPIAWYKEFEGGRSFYTNLGHRPETWSEPLFQQHLLAGLRWAAAPNNYNRIVLTNAPRNPMELAVANDGRVLFVERTGELRVWQPDTGQVIEAGTLPVDTTAESGLLGMALDPAFDQNNRLYLYHSEPISNPAPEGPPGRNILSVFRLNSDSTLDLSSREDIIEVPSERDCCHEGGSLAFGPDGSLFLSVGDNTNPFPAAGSAPLDERPGKETENAQRTAQNPFELRGSILRIHPDGSIPPGNLYPLDGSQGRPEIYIKGNRNPFRIAVDPDTGRLFWGEVGPDAVVDGARGPRGYDEINFADAAGNYGWPYCIGPNIPYNRYNYATEEVGAPYSCDGFMPALLAYDYLSVTARSLGNAVSSEAGAAFTGRTAIAGAFYRAPASAAPFVLPPPFRDNLLMTEWTRDIIAAVEVDDTGALGAVTRLLPWERFRRPIDLAVGPDGALYVLEYGTSFYGDNADAQVTRIEYSTTGELSPVARATASVSAGSPPLTVMFSATGSRTPGRDSIENYEWDFDGDGRVDSHDAEASFTYVQAGHYTATLRVVGVSGEISYPAATEIVVGNTEPQVNILTPSDDTTVDADSLVELSGVVTDVEDRTISCDDLTWDIRLGHNAHSHPLFLLSGCDAQFLASLGGHDDGGTIFYAVELRYTDKGGANGEPLLTGRDGIRINVR